MDVVLMVVALVNVVYVSVMFVAVAFVYIVGSYHDVLTPPLRLPAKRRCICMSIRYYK